MSLSKIEGANISLEKVADPHTRSKDRLWMVSSELPLGHKWVYSKLARTISTVYSALEGYRFHEAANAVYQFFWGDFCDWYVEWVKPELLDEGSTDLPYSWYNIFSVFDSALRLLHPFMPFLTEELWHQLPQRNEDRSIALQGFPSIRADWIDEEAERQFGCIQNVITVVRNIRSEAKVDARKRVVAEFSSNSGDIRRIVEANRDDIMRLALLSDLVITSERVGADGMIRSTADFDLRVPFADIVDPQVEILRLKKDREGLQKAIDSKERQLGDETFRSRAPEKIIKGLEATLAQQKIELEKLQRRLGDLDGGSSQAAGT